MEISWRLTLPSEAASIPAVRHVVGSTMACLGINADCIDDVEVAVTEACTNVLMHAAGANHDYEVEVSIGTDQVTVRVRDSGDGSGFERPFESFDLPAEGGRGILLMRALVDDVEFRTKPGVGTVVSLTKRIDLRHDALLLRFDDGERRVAGGRSGGLFIVDDLI